MDDLISRQAAIRIASGYCHLANIAKELSKLPSAQPEIIRCKECKYVDEDGVCQNDKGLAIQDDYNFCSHAERREE